MCNRYNPECHTIYAGAANKCYRESDREKNHIISAIGIIGIFVEYGFHYK
jgi:hypothetical protein